MNVDIRETQSKIEREQLDNLLWEVLWKNLDLPKDSRNAYKLAGNEIEVAAFTDQICIGGLVGVLNGNVAELRHIAVHPDYQRVNVGRALLTEFIEILRAAKVSKVKTYARNTSERFFSKHGFTRVGGKSEHPDFTKSGIYFYEMACVLDD